MAGGEGKGGVIVDEDGEGEEGALLQAMSSGYMTALRCGLKEGRDQYPRTLWALGEPAMPPTGISEFTDISSSMPSSVCIA